MNNTHSNIMRLLRTAKNMASLSGVNGSPHSALDFIRRDSSVYDISEHRRSLAGHSDCKPPYLPEDNMFSDYISEVERTFGNLHMKDSNLYQDHYMHHHGSSLGLSGPPPGRPLSLGSASSLEGGMFDCDSLGGGVAPIFTTQPCSALTHRNMSKFDLLSQTPPSGQSFKSALPDVYGKFSFKGGASSSTYIPGHSYCGGRGEEDGNIRSDGSDISTHTVTYGNLEGNAKKRKQYRDSLKKRPASAKSRRELDEIELGYRRKPYHISHHHYHGHRSTSPPPVLPSERKRGGNDGNSYLFREKESVRDFYLDQFRPKEGVPQWEHVDLTEGPANRDGGVPTCTSLVPVDDFLKNKPKKPDPKASGSGLAGGEWECRNCRAGGGKQMYSGMSCGSSAGGSRPSSATCMRCEGCKKTGTLYDISEDNNHMLEQMGGGQGGVAPQSQVQQRRKGGFGKPLRRQHSYDTFVDLQKDDTEMMSSLIGGMGEGGGMGGPGMGGMLPPPRSVSLKEKERYMEGGSPFAHIFDRHGGSERDRDRDPLFYGEDRGKGPGSPFGLFRGNEGPHRRSIGERDMRDKGLMEGGFSLSKSLYPDRVNQNPFIPTFGDDQCLMHGAKQYYMKKQQQQQVAKSSRSDFRSQMSTTSYVQGSSPTGVMSSVAPRFPKELSLGGMNHHGSMLGVGPPRPFNGSNGHVYEKLSSIESDV
uniref:Glutamate [NMDA] receptor epsilon subunit C-terminal domain-containing protein n=2 Tax=Knipowitschia caucasica TaxID=637954 RepID=A0AAV2KJE8_KNICA